MSGPEVTAALCLSGGGNRAAAFHTGVLWRLNELGLLEKLTRISAVSGGAVTAGCLALAWPRLEFKAGVAGRFKDLVVSPVRRLLDIDVGTWATILGWLPGRTGYGELTRCFSAHLYGNFTLGQIEAAPDFVFCATDLRYGSLWTFDKGEMGNHATGWFDARNFTLAAAVAAASAVPVLFAPARVDLRPYPKLRNGEDLSARPYNTAILCDGGVYDDQGLDPVSNGSDTVLISDASEGLPVQKRPASNWPCQLARVGDIALSQVHVQRLARALSAFDGINKSGTVFALTATPPDTMFDGFDNHVTKGLAGLPTRFVPIARRTQEDLINWGYVICTAQMRKLPQFPTLPAAVPYPR